MAEKACFVWSAAVSGVPPVSAVRVDGDAHAEVGVLGVAGPQRLRRVKTRRPERPRRLDGFVSENEEFFFFFFGKL